MGITALLVLGCGPTFVAPAPPFTEPAAPEALARALEAALVAREEAALEALDPQRAERRRAALLDRGTLADLRAVGEDLFHRDTPWRPGTPPKPVDPLRTGGADATRCLGCHRVGGTGGSGGFGDVAFFEATGDDVQSAQRRLPRMLAGAALLDRAGNSMNSSAFGWMPGRPRTLAAMVEWSVRTHLGEQPTADEVAALTVFIALLPPPMAYTPDRPGVAEAVARGEALFGSVGCAACHTPTLPVHDPVLPLGNGQTLDLTAWLGRPPFAVRAYTDLKPHALGGEAVITPPLWGVASRGPYLHDGRASDLIEAVEAHDGEASAARDAWRALGRNQSDVLAFLASLGRLPRMEWIR